MAVPKIQTFVLSLLTVALSASAAHAADAPRSQRVQMTETAASIVADATVEAVRQATLAPQVTGRVLEMRVDAGDRVKAGQVLARIDSREAAQAEAAARAQLIQAQSQRDRTKSLLEKKFVSPAAMDKAEADYLSAKALADQAGVGASHGTLVAPISGVVGERLAQAGDMAVPGKPILTVFDPRSLRVTAALPQQQVSALKGSLKARIEFTDTGRWIDAVHVEVLPTADARTHTATVRAQLPDGTTDVLPGAYARLHLLMGQTKKLLVPAAAVVRRGEVTLVYVLDTQGAPHLRQVRLGETSAEGYEVLAGISAGEQVALDPIQAGMEARKNAKP
ncbi:MAG TPA: efflux RND transporter periplasmic adaptor subunit [Rhodocyclaceae bacterium]|nr:efflux RND transporter periplasmic adaptor subunit [Rhodocyclaceae bacterium]